MAIDVNPRTYQKFVRPLLFMLPAEFAYHLATRTLRLKRIWGDPEAAGSTSPNIRTSVAGIQLENPVGLAAGFDKNCEILPALSYLGFGYLSCGTVTLAPRQGNRRTRLLRDAPTESLLNSMGFPNSGLDKAIQRITHGQRWRTNTPIVVSISGTQVGDIVTCHRRLEPLVDAVEINISSPNTTGLRLFHDADVLADLLTSVSDRRSRPLFVKVPPFPDEQRNAELHDQMLSLAEVCVSAGVEALTVANTQPVSDRRLGVGSGGLSGKPIYERMLRMVAEVRSVVGDSVAINACGGIFTADDAWGALCAGADTVQLLTGMVYRGPGVARDISRELARLVSLNGMTSVRDLRPETSVAQVARTT